eukprot:COSAG05_NODE_22041_length_267_cov_0.928571_1_plen_48_part_10
MLGRSSNGKGLRREVTDLPAAAAKAEPAANFMALGALLFAGAGAVSYI